MYSTDEENFFFGFQDNQWKKVKGKSGSNVPKGRRGHTALVYRNSMIIYGGYRDLKGSTNEMWAFHFGNLKIN